MRVWSGSELNNVAKSLTPLVGLRLQEIMTADADVALGFYSSQGILWLWADLNALAPSLLPWSSLPLALKPKKNPLHLFLRAHFVGRVLSDVSVDPERGRIVFLRFGAENDPEAARLEVHLYPHRRNLIAMAAGKKIAWQKPSAEPETIPSNTSNTNADRDLEKLREDWFLMRGKRGKGAVKSGDPKVKIENDLTKKRKALEKVREELTRKQDMPWREVGELLKASQKLDVPKEWEVFIDRRRKLSWNIENCFTKAREILGKVTGTEKRLTVLENEIAALEERLTKPSRELAREPEARPAPQPLTDGAAQGRTLRLNEQVTVVSGKSAADNMKILRRARAWDLWMHMRDYPSSHAVLFRNKGTKITDAELRQVGEWFVRNHFGQKAKDHSGEKFELILAECRFVSPIKGDKIGRVTYRDERILICQLP